MQNTFAIDNWMNRPYEHVEPPDAYHNRTRVQPPSEIQQGPRLTQETIFDESQDVTRSTLDSSYDPNETPEEIRSAKTRLSTKLRNPSMPRFFGSIKETEVDQANWDSESNNSTITVESDMSDGVDKFQSPHGIKSPLSSSSNESTFATEPSPVKRLYSHSGVESSFGWDESPVMPTRAKDGERTNTSDDNDESSSNDSRNVSNSPLERTRLNHQNSMNYKPLNDPNISNIDDHLPPTNIGHTTIESLRHDDLVNEMQQNTSSLRNDMYQNNFDNRKNTKILMENLNDFPLASELYKNKRITMSQASNKKYMEQIENELRETKKSIKANETSRKGDSSISSKIATQKPIYRYEASTRPMLYKGLNIYTPPHASRPTYSNDPRKWGAGHAQHGEGILMDAITDGVQLAYSSVSPIVNGANWVRNKMEGNGRCHPNSKNCWGGRKIYPDSLSDLGTILGL